MTRCEGNSERASVDRSTRRSVGNRDGRTLNTPARPFCDPRACLPSELCTLQGHDGSLVTITSSIANIGIGRAANSIGRFRELGRWAQILIMSRQLMGSETTCHRLSMNRSIDSLSTRRTPRKASRCAFRHIDLMTFYAPMCAPVRHRFRLKYVKWMSNEILRNSRPTSRSVPGTQNFDPNQLRPRKRSL